MHWKVIESKRAKKQIVSLPNLIRRIYYELVGDLGTDGPYPHGWESKPLQNQSRISIRLNREYRVLVEVHQPNVIVVQVAHRKEIYR